MKLANISLQHLVAATSHLLSVLIMVLAPCAVAQIKVEVSGDHDGLKKNILLHLSSWEKLPEGDPEDIRSALEPEIQQAARALGYYAAKTEYRLKDANLLVIVTPGDPVVWGESSVTVRHQNEVVDGKLQTLIDAQPFRRGEPINHKVYEDYKKRLVNYAIENGYFDAVLIKNELLIEPDNYVARVTLELQAGKRYVIAGAEFSGTQVRPELIELVAEIPVGDWYTANTVGAVYNRLLNSGYFSNVSIDVIKRETDDVILNIKLTERPTSLFSTGVGFATDDEGLRFRFKWAMPKVNERGDNLQAQTKISSVEQDVLFGYNIPWNHPQNEFISLDVGWQHKLTDNIETGQAKTGVAYNRILNGGWQYSLGVDYNNETSALGDQDETSFTYVMPVFNLSKRHFVGEPADPEGGYKYWVSMGASNEVIGSDTNFFKIEFGINYLQRLAERHDLVTRLELGYIHADRFLEVPPSLRFFSGGDQTIRGYKYESISPEDPEGNNIGGNEQLIGSIEYRYKILAQWKLAVFIDAGRVSYDKQNEIDITAAQATAWKSQLSDSTDFYMGTGVGVRWTTPVGAISLDVAVPVNQPDSNPRIHFYFGTSL